jgi:integrase
MRRSKGPRIELETRSGREPLWRIRDGEKSVRLGLPESQRDEAEERLAEYLMQKHDPAAVKAAAGEISIPEVLAFYLRSLNRRVTRQRNDSIEKSVGTRMIHIDNLLTFWADKTLADVRTSVCEDYADHRRQQGHRRGMRKGAVGAADSTIRQELKTLDQAIKVWHGEAPLAARPVITKPKQLPPKIRCLERDEVARLLRAARSLRFGHLVRYILIGAYTGTRDDRIRRLRWPRATHDGYVDLRRGILYRAGDAEGATTKRAPAMILPDRLLAHMRRWERIDTAAGLSHVVTYMKPLPVKPKGKLRAIRDNTPPRSPQPVGDIHKSWASIRIKAGLDDDVTPHTLKHTCISWMLWEGRRLWEVAEDTGTSVKTLEDVYAHYRNVESRLDRDQKRAPIWRLSGASA